MLFEFEKYEANSQTMKVSKDIVDIVKAILSPSEIQAVECVLELLPSSWYVLLLQFTTKI